MSIHPATSNPTNQSGFTLVETLVALVILTMALIPIFTLSTGTTRIGATIQDDLIAAGLAQEGIEVVRAMRDTNWFNSRAFDSGLGSGVIGQEDSYRVQWDSSSLLALSGNPSLKLNGGVYTYIGGSDTKFSRKVKITKINAVELRVISEVSWLTPTNPSKTIAAEEHLFDWR